MGPGLRSPVLKEAYVYNSPTLRAPGSHTPQQVFPGEELRPPGALQAAGGTIFLPVLLTPL